MTKKSTPAPAKSGKPAAKKESLKDLTPKAGKDSAIKGGGTAACTMTWKSTGKSSC